MQAPIFRQVLTVKTLLGGGASPQIHNISFQRSSDIHRVFQVLPFLDSVLNSRARLGFRSSANLLLSP